MFEKLVIEAAQRLNVPTATVSSILGSLIGTMTNDRTGGINGFVDSFRRAGVGDSLTSWIGGKEGKPLDDLAYRARTRLSHGCEHRRHERRHRARRELRDRDSSFLG